MPWFDDTDLLARLEELGYALPAFDDPWLHDFGSDFADDFEGLAAFLAAPPPTPDRDSSDDLMAAALEELGVNLDNPFPSGPPLAGMHYDALLDVTEDRSREINFGVPEPSTLGLFATLLSLCGLGAGKRRKSGPGRLPRISVPGGK